MTVPASTEVQVEELAQWSTNVRALEFARALLMEVATRTDHASTQEVHHGCLIGAAAADDALEALMEETEDE